MPDSLPLRAARKVPSFFAAPIIWPSGVVDSIPEGPCIYIAPLESRTDERILRASLAAAGLPVPRWIASTSQRSVDESRLREAFLGGEPVLVPLAAPKTGPDRLARLLSWAQQEDAPVSLVPMEALWGPRSGRPRLRSVMFGDPYDPPGWTRLARLVRRESVRVILGRPGTRHELAQSAPHPDDALALSTFVRGQAVKALSLTEREVLGDRYKVPRLVKEQILQEPDFRDQIARAGSVAGLTRTESLARAEKALTELATGHSILRMELFRRFTSWAYTRVYDPEIVVSDDELEKLRTLGKKSALVFTPSHKSNFDHLVLYDLFFSHGFPPPHTAAGNNMSFFPMSWILPGTGAYFIRRSFQDDVVYKECLRGFMTYLVQRRFNQEFFIEGGRTRSGKLLPPRYGMLRYVVEGVRRSAMQDVHFVPTAITYDQILEVGEYVRQEQGEPKERESFGFLMRMMRSLRGRDFGRIYIRFGEPIALSDHLERHGDDSLLVEKLAFEIANDINTATHLTGVAVVCSALLSAGRCALTLDELTRQTERTLDFAREHGICLARELQEGAKQTFDSATEALLDAKLIEVYEGGADPVYSVPPEQRPVAAYYRNAVIHFFLLRAMATLAERGASDERSFEDWGLRLRELLKFEFFFRDRDNFARQLAAERDGQASESKAGLDPLGAAGPGILLDYLESYWVATQSLESVARTHNYMTESEFVTHCHAMGKQLLLQNRVSAPELLSNSNFRNALKLMVNLGAAESSPKGYRRGSPEALNLLSQDLLLLVDLARR